MKIKDRYADNSSVVNYEMVYLGKKRGVNFSLESRYYYFGKGDARYSVIEWTDKSGLRLTMFSDGLIYRLPVELAELLFQSFGEAFEGVTGVEMDGPSEWATENDNLTLFIDKPIIISEISHSITYRQDLPFRGLVEKSRWLIPANRNLSRYDFILHDRYLMRAREEFTLNSLFIDCLIDDLKITDTMRKDKSNLSVDGVEGMRSPVWGEDCIYLIER